MFSADEHVEGVELVAILDGLASPSSRPFSPEYRGEGSRKLVSMRRVHRANAKTVEVVEVLYSHEFSYVR
jgi:hypothetical protein